LVTCRDWSRRIAAAKELRTDDGRKSRQAQDFGPMTATNLAAFASAKPFLPDTALT
jgi:hypothetical protein